ncbi:Stk1 family PASTA domain-containing Ser/Thr kinase [Thermovenabulum gondwanense]|uniref:non-specific serine/threonine protein kinase n=1 Tax=Thermovenabulum gondwanense TaxID=520767 RepID=A0A162MN19_9FIRM|nr:Stk1 family PASTA domain-containing Ser/Thr kinase [Thermovenabulum gondwanense]KYO66754.1 Serine/threonine-protein kinase PrkC [Thermovenabulum gondwanense]
MLGRKLGNRYLILEEIGGGGMAIVYKARCTLLNRLVAVKVLRPEYSNDDDFVIRFRREAQAAASLSHPNIVSIYDVGKEDGIHYIVMEYVEGKTLKQIIKEEGPLPAPLVLEIARQICDAIECAHKNKIIHRDIKPHNVIITPEGRVKVTDFGIARAINCSTITNSGGIVGSVHYFSPEQAKGDYTDERSDIYSFGVLLYEAFTGKLPFTGDSPVSVALKHLQEKPASISKMLSGFPDFIEDIISRCLEKLPENRYQTISELKRDIIKAQKKLEESGFVLPESEKTMIFKGMEEGEKIKATARKINRKRSYFHVFLILSSLIILFIAFSYLGMYIAKQYFDVPEVTVPNVIGLSEEEAAKKLAEKNLKYEVTERIFSNEPVGEVVDQDPKGGEVVKINHPPVSLIVSKGPRTFEVPRVIGLSETEAINLITSSNFKVGQIQRANSSEYPQGVVMDQNPREGLLLPENTEINITISLGPEAKKVIIPYLIGKSLTEAQNELITANLSIGQISYKPSSDYEKNFVIDQNPKAGLEVDNGTIVNLTVSSGKVETKKFNLSIPLPQREGEFAVKVVVTDDKGKRTIYENKHSSKDSPVIVPVEGTGTIDVEVWVDGELWYKSSF